MGFGVYPGQYFKALPKPKEDVVNKEQYDHMLEEWREMKTGWKQMQEKLDNTTRKLEEVTKERSMRDSNTSPRPAFPEGLFQCVLYLGDTVLRVVGKGQAHNFPSQMLHNCPLPSNQLKVMVQIATEPHATLPCPDRFGELTTIGDALGCFVACPCTYIGLDALTPQTSAAAPPMETHYSNESPIHKSPIRETTSRVATSKPTNPPSMNLQLLDMFYSLKMQESGSTISCNIAASIVQENEVNTWIDANCLHSVLYRDWLDGTVIDIYSSYLYKEISVPSGCTDRYVFISPQLTTAFVATTEHDKVVGRMLYNKRGQDKLFLVPYNHDGRHWVLTALSLTNFGKVYFFDSLRKDLTHYEPMKTMIKK